MIMGLHYYSVPIWTLKFEIVFIFLHMGMHKNGIDGHRLYVNFYWIKVKNNNKTSLFKCQSVWQWCTNCGHWNKQLNTVNWTETCWGISFTSY